MFLIAESSGFPAISIEKLETLGNVYLAGDNFDPASIQVIFIRLNRKITDDYMVRFPNLDYLVSPTTGLNHIDLRAADERSVKVISLRGEVDFLSSIRATAEHTIALTLSLLRMLPSSVNSVKSGVWDRNLFVGSEIFGRKVFLLGYGRIGKQLAELYKAFGAHVMAYDKVGNVPDEIAVDLSVGLASADIVSIHISYSLENDGFVSRKMLEQIRPEAILVNTSRGEVIDQRALFDLIDEEKIAGAALDVLRNEPHPLSSEVDQAIQKLGERLLITPHIGGLTRESLEKVEMFVVNKIVDLLGAPSGRE